MAGHEEAAALTHGKAKGTLLTGASLRRKPEAADGLAMGCLAQADKILQASGKRRGTPWVPSRVRTPCQGLLGHPSVFMAGSSWLKAEVRDTTRWRHHLGWHLGSGWREPLALDRVSLGTCSC